LNIVLADETRCGLDSLAVYREFSDRASQHRDALMKVLHGVTNRGQLVLGYGASTKGNVMLQFCGITPQLIPAIAEVNADKFGCFTPQTLIPIISEKEAHAMHPDVFLVLPWHFRCSIVERERAFLEAGGKFLFPLPSIELTDSANGAAARLQ
jgi:hypothetical protein